MSLRDEYHRLIQDAQTTADFLQNTAQFMRQRAEIHRSHIDVVKGMGASLVGYDNSAIRGITPDAHTTLQQEIARARYRLGNLHDHADQLWHTGAVMRTIIADVGGPLMSALDMIPEPIWDFFGGFGITVPSLSDVLLHGDAHMPRLQDHWEWNAGAAMNFLQGLGSFFHIPGFSGGPASPSVQQTHATVSVAL
ncbi:MAG TPA: hypothetical protein VKB76_06855, partial [Ktedonobacterales bacterium]|nr:hypothetical protein [Ktedonobacterales bacterium]